MKRRTVNLALLAKVSGLASMPAFAQEADVRTVQGTLSTHSYLN